MNRERLLEHATRLLQKAGGREVRLAWFFLRSLTGEEAKEHG